MVNYTDELQIELGLNSRWADPHEYLRRRPVSFIGPRRGKIVKRTRVVTPAECRRRKSNKKFIENNVR